MQVAVARQPLRSTWGAAVYAFFWALAILLCVISYIAVLGEAASITSFNFGGLATVFIAWILSAGFGIYSVYTWFAAANNVDFVPNSAAMICGIIACVIGVNWQFGVTISYQILYSFIVALGGCQPGNAHPICTSLEALLIGMWCYLIMTFTTMIILSVDHVAYFGCCCNGEGRIKKTVAVVAVATAGVQMQQQQPQYAQQPQGYVQTQPQGYVVQQQYAQQPQGYVQTQPQGYAVAVQAAPGIPGYAAQQQPAGYAVQQQPQAYGQQAYPPQAYGQAGAQGYPQQQI